MRLINFIGEYEKLLRAFDACEDDTQEADIENALLACADQIEEKLENCAWMYKQLEAESEAYKKEAERLTLKAKYRANSATRLKDYISLCLQGKNIKTKTFTLSFRASESVEVLNPDLVPEQYKRVKTVIEPDKTLIKPDLKAGANIPGVQLVTKQNLQIK